MRIFSENFIPSQKKKRRSSIFPIQSIVRYGPLPSFCELFDAAAIPRLLLGGEELSTGLFHLMIIIEAPPAQEMSHGPKQVVIGWCKVRTVSWMRQELDALQLPDIPAAQSVLT